MTFAVSVYSQERALLFNVGIFNHPDKLAATKILFKVSEYTSANTAQVELGWRRPLKGESWHTEFIISYRQSSAEMKGYGTLYDESVNTYHYYSGEITNETSLFMPGLRFGVSKKWELGQSNSAILMTIGVLEYALFYNSQAYLIPDSPHGRPLSSERKWGFKNLSYGLYTRPTYEFDLNGSLRDFRLMAYVEINYMSKNRAFAQPSRYYGLGIGARYEL